MDIRAGILTIGDEVVQGQITNINASWLSTQLTKLNITPSYHLSCLDESNDINNSLHFLKKHCKLIIISGGLGPTIDDCTRQSLSQWLNQKLIFNNDEWLKIEALLKSKNLTIRQGHRNQAQFPKGSQVLSNHTGVAPGFFTQANDTFIAALPGPPSELQPMFNNQLSPIIKEKLKPEKDLKLYKWICLGSPESELAHIAESIFGPHHSINLGYRLYKPYVEVKAWAPKSLNAELNKLFNTFEDKIKPWFVSHSIEEIRKNFHKSLNNFNNIYVIDHLSSGLLLDKLKEAEKSDHIRYQCFEHKAYKHFTKEEVQKIYQHMVAQSSQLFICLFPHTETSALLSFNDKIYLVETPRKISIRSKLGQLYIIENLFLKGIDHLK